ncbi:MAG: zf-HC2 domain-containing protein [Oscillospiraceae bacterium]|nr:zf-HC2 domain-containing protein [Oscillospiraceae bacterium]
MNTDCEIIRDLLPLYAEGLCSPASRALVEAHLEGCGACRQCLAQAQQPDPAPAYSVEPARSFRKYVRREQHRHGWKVALVTAVCVLGAVFVRLAVMGGLMGFLMLDSFLAKPVQDTDVRHYAQYMGENAEKEYRDKWGMDESVFPERITPDMQVDAYSMTYYNPWDAQFLSYLTVTYDEEAYAQELSRLEECPHTEYDYYSVTGFAGQDDPIAMFADPYQGFVYAIHTPGKAQSITYVELIFCNYALDVEAADYIPAAYLPEGFDASYDNPYGKRMLAQP